MHLCAYHSRPSSHWCKHGVRWWTAQLAGRSVHSANCRLSVHRRLRVHRVHWQLRCHSLFVSCVIPSFCHSVIVIVPLCPDHQVRVRLSSTQTESPHRVQPSFAARPTISQRGSTMRALRYVRHLLRWLHERREDSHSTLPTRYPTPPLYPATATLLSLPFPPFISSFLFDN